MIHICLCFTDEGGQYYKNALTTLISVFEHTKSKVCAHIISDDTFTEEAKEHFIKVGNGYNQTIQFYSIENIPARIRDNIPKNFGAGSLFRLFIPEIISEEKILYLDCDIICQLDIQELFGIDISSVCMGAVVDGADDVKIHGDIKNNGMNHEYYINSGVILLNSKKLRTEYPYCKDAILDMVAQKKMMFPDQHAINMFFPVRHWLEPKEAPDAPVMTANIFSDGITGKEGIAESSANKTKAQGAILLLPAKYNFRLSFIENAYQPLYAYAGKIIHFTGDKPWKALYPGALLYWKYYCRYFPASEAFDIIEKQDLHELIPMFHFMVRERSARRLFNRCYQLKSQGVWETVLDRLFPARRKAKRLSEKVKEYL